MVHAVVGGKGDRTGALEEQRLLLSHGAFARAVWCVGFTSQEVHVCHATISTPV